MKRFVSACGRVVAGIVVFCGCVASADDPLGSFGSQGFDPLAEVAAELGDPIVITASIEPGRDGTPDTLTVTATLEAGRRSLGRVVPARRHAPRRLLGLAEPARLPFLNAPRWPAPSRPAHLRQRGR
jgi:hypothetical protein